MSRAPAVVANPAKLTDPERTRADVTTALHEVGMARPHWFETTEDDPGTGQARAAAEAGADVVLALGGDGTVRACAAGLAGGDVPLALLPAGTGNLLARNLGLPTGLVDAVRVAATGRRIVMDLVDLDGELYTVMGGCGFDAAMFQATSERWKGAAGWAAYAWAALSTARRSEPVGLRLDVDGERHELVAAGVVVANVGRLTGGLQLVPHARPDDGLLHVAVLMPHSLGRWLGLGARMLLRRPPDGKHLRTFRGCDVRLEWDVPQPTEIDGELVHDRRTATFRIRPRALTVCVA
jgi:diacylglycerol kinase family enzyme